MTSMFGPTPARRQAMVAIDGSRFKHEAVLDAMQERLDRAPGGMRIRRQTAEHPFGTIKAWMGATHFRLRRHCQSKFYTAS
jgi:hypothetical protein